MGDESERLFRFGIDGAAHESGGFGSVGDHAVEIDAGGDAAHVAASLYRCGHLTPVVNAGVENAVFVAVKVIGGEDLHVAEAAVDGVFAEAVCHEGKVAAGQQQSSHASAHHEQRHQGAAAVAEDVAKGK